MNFVVGFFKNLNLKVPAGTVAAILTPLIMAGLKSHGVNLPPGADVTVVTPLIVFVIGWLTPSKIAAQKG
jgi:hypothetical protein